MHHPTPTAIGASIALWTWMTSAHDPSLLIVTDDHQLPSGQFGMPPFPWL